MTRTKIHPSIWFLGIIAVLVLTVVGFLLWLQANQTKALQIAFVPTTPITEEPLGPAPDYSDTKNWAAYRDQPSRALETPAGVDPVGGIPPVDIVFLHPTTALPAPLADKRWNALLADDLVNKRTDNFAAAHIASAFSPAGAVYAPRYRQATIGAFFDTSGQGQTAMQRAYGDILAAFDYYLDNLNQGRPFILAGHSQGSLHALMLLRDRISGTPILRQMVGAYLIGWPISVEADLKAVGVPACETATDTGCVISYQAFAEGGDPSDLLAIHAALPGLLGASRDGTQMLCTNPLTWSRGGAATRGANLGGLPVDETAAELAQPIPELTGARCGEDGILYLTDPPGGDWRNALLPGENYHAVDIPLFYMNIRQNALERSHAYITHISKPIDRSGGVAVSP